MFNRIKSVRASRGLTQEQFAERVGVSRNYVARIEIGERTPSDLAIRAICREFGVNETWLRTGVGDPFLPSVREQEIAALTKTLMSDRPESFRSRLVTALLKFPPDAPEWEALEKIYDSIEAELKESDQ